MTISLQNTKFKELMQQCKYGKKNAYDEACKIILFHIKPFLEHKFKNIDYDILYAIVDHLLKQRIEMKGYDEDILVYSRYVLKGSYVKIEKLQLNSESIEERVNNINNETNEEFVDKATLIQDIIERLNIKKDPSLTDNQLAYMDVIKSLDIDSEEEFVDKLFLLTYNYLYKYVSNNVVYSFLDKDDITDTLNDVILNKIREWYGNKDFPKQFYMWIQLAKRSVKLVLDNLNKKHFKNEYIDVIKDRDVFIDESLDPSPEEMVLEEELKNVLNKLIDHLDLKDQAIIRMRYEKEMTFREIAEELNMSRQRVEQHEKRILGNLYIKLVRYQKCYPLNL